MPSWSTIILSQFCQKSDFFRLLQNFPISNFFTDLEALVKLTANTVPPKGFCIFSVARQPICRFQWNLACLLTWTKLTCVQYFKSLRYTVAEELYSKIFIAENFVFLSVYLGNLYRELNKIWRRQSSHRSWPKCKISGLCVTPLLGALSCRQTVSNREKNKTFAENFEIRYVRVIVYAEFENVVRFSEKLNLI